MRRLLLLAAVLVTACGRAPERPPPPAIPQRIISVVPNATEMLFALGVGDRVIAVGDYDNFPAEVQTRPRIGGLLNPNIEKIIEMHPDMMVMYGSQDVLHERLGAVGIRLYPFTHGDVSQTLSYIEDLGKAVGKAGEGRQIAAHIRSTFADLAKESASPRPTVLLVHNRGTGLLGSFYSVGARAFQSELIEVGGGRNVFGDMDKEILTPSLEEVIRRGPEVIIETIPGPGSAAEIAQREKDWLTLAALPAVANHRVYVVAEDYMLVPGPRMDLAARKYAELIRKR